MAPASELEMFEAFFSSTRCYEGETMEEGEALSMGEDDQLTKSKGLEIFQKTSRTSSRSLAVQ